MPPTPASNPLNFAAAVAASQKRAVALYPDLGKLNSALNLRFRAEYNAWRAQRDARLSRPDWPELLAAECANQVASAR